MEFRSIEPGCNAPVELSRGDRLAFLKTCLESALDLADDLDLGMVGINLDQALHEIDGMAR